MKRGSHLAEKALRGLLADAASGEDFRRARRFAELNGLDYPERTSGGAREDIVAQTHAAIERAGALRPSMPTRSARSARGRGTSAAELRRYLDTLSSDTTEAGSMSTPSTKASTRSASAAPSKARIARSAYRGALERRVTTNARLAVER
jgi:hypothetical protein